jgi:hypothetical protein
LPLKHLSDSIKVLLYERIKNPIIGSIILSFIVWNWAPILYFLLAKDDVATKISAIIISAWQQPLLPNQYNVNWGYSILIGVAFSLVLPYLTLAYHYIVSLAQKVTIKLKQEVDGERRITKEASRLIVDENDDLKDKIFEIKKELTVLRNDDEKSNKISGLQNDIEVLEKQASSREKYHNDKVYKLESGIKINRDIFPEMFKFSNLNLYSVELAYLDDTYGTSELNKSLITKLDFLSKAVYFTGSQNKEGKKQGVFYFASQNKLSLNEIFSVFSSHEMITVINVSHGSTDFSLEDLMKTDLSYAIAK